jgi:hypothetical protein
MVQQGRRQLFNDQPLLLSEGSKPTGVEHFIANEEARSVVESLEVVHDCPKGI